MKRVKAFLRKIFSLSRGETNGFLILVPLMAVILFSEPIYRAWSTSRTPETKSDSKKLDSLIAQWDWEMEKIDSIKSKATIPSRKFSFDPNTATKDQFIELGFSTNLSQRIINYRSKGGSFKTKSDLKKIYGMDSLLYKQLIPFIELPNKIVKPTYAEKKTETSAPKITQFDINEADTAQLKKIYGIGNVLSVRIVTYRDRLGGFVSTKQLSEVYGLDSTVLKTLNERTFVGNEFQVKTIDINQASEKELSAHPYIKSKLAKAITAYRFQHGNFTAIEDLQRIALIDNETFGRIKPYLVLNK